MAQRELIVSALDKLGPTRATRMLSAFDDHRTPKGGWFDCPVAFAHGEPGSLIRDHGHLMDISRTDEPEMIFGVTPHDAANALDISVEEVCAMTQAYDGVHGSTVSKFELHSLIAAAAIQPLAVVGV